MFANDQTTAETPPPGLRFPWQDPPATAEVTEVADGILWVRAPLPMRLDHVNCYVLDEGEGWTVVDTGLNTNTCREAWEAILAGPLGGRPVTRVVLTHHHPDHIGLAGWFAEMGAEIWCTRLGYALGRMMQMDTSPEQPPEAIRFRRLAGQPEDEIAAWAKEPPFRFKVGPIPLGFHAIEEGDTIRMGWRDWTVHFGHGHAWNHATFWTADGSEEGIVLAGDQIIPGISSNVGVWALEPGADTVGAWLESCVTLRNIASGGDPLVLPGHKMPFRGINHRLTQLIDNHHSALERIRKALAERPRTAAEMFLPIFMREIRGSQYGLALAEAVAHMNHMMAIGQARRDLKNGAWVYSLVEGS